MTDNIVAVAPTDGRHSLQCAGCQRDPRVRLAAL